jgi:hypothetical protein
MCARVSRRGFTTLLATGGAGLFWPWPWPLRAASLRTRLSAAQQQWLTEALPRRDSAYDPFAKMLVVSSEGTMGDPTGRRSGDIHATQPSLAYAAALLDTGENWRVERAREILRSVVPLQDQDSDSKTFGRWPWCLEEPLTPTHTTQPDVSWVDRCGIELLVIWMGNRSQLRSPLEQSVREAIGHTARALQARPLNPDATHDAIVQVGIGLLAAQEFRLTDLRTDAKARLRQLYDYVVQQGSFAEYNSPTESLLALQELARLQALVRDARDTTLLSALHDLAWKHVATHFHAPSQQWAGPHHRALETNLAKQPATLAFFQKACGTSLRFPGAESLALNLEVYRLPVQCPRKWTRQFGPLEGPREVVETFIQPAAKPGARNPVVGTTWLHPRYALGSVNRGDFWKERRPLLAYWGTADAPRFLRARFLKDHRDFSSALFFSVQHRGYLLAVVTFATNHGDTHPALDPLPTGNIAARQLQLRFEFGGALGRCTMRTRDDKSQAILVQDEQVRFVLQPVADAFFDARFVWEQPGLGLATPIHAVAHHGDEKNFSFATAGEAFVCFTLSEWPYEEKLAPPAVEIRRSPGRLHARWTLPDKILDLQVPTQPASFEQMNDGLRVVLA